jgi:UDP-N-acetylmuramyl pentapeptide phosphotransferase/UDP-N-acetylglucosamine-1-phosphate transferase
VNTAVPVLLILGAVLWHIMVFRLAPRLGLVKPNFRKTPIMASYGIVSFGYVAAAIVTAAYLGPAQWRHALLYLWVMAVMWALGAADDIWGSREVGGFAGHFRKLFTQGKITTGAVKAIGGGIVGIAAGYVISEGEPVRWALAAVLIPLTANMLNLLDLRPGRASAVFFLGLGVTCLVTLGRLQAPWVVGAIALVAFAWAIPDSRGKAMMGDSGSNSLGAALGVTVALNTFPAFQMVAILCIAALHVFSERHSISDLIERNPILRRLDRLVGVR